MLDSSIWLEDPDTRIVWVTLLLMKDEDGLVNTKSAAVIAHKANIQDVDKVKAALDKFKLPDKESHRHSEKDEGRRITEVAEGYLVLNHDQYRYSSEAKREFWRVMKAEQRKRDLRKLELAKQGRLREPRKKVVTNETIASVDLRA